MEAILTVAAIPDQNLKGTITKIALQSDNLNNNTSNTSNSNSSSTPFNIGFQIEIGQLEIPPNITLRSGFSATAKINVKTVKQVPIIPERVLIYKDEKPFVNTLLLQNKKPILTPIQLGISDGINVQVVKGLVIGQQVLEPTNSEEEKK